MKNRKADERTALRNRFWPGAKAWTGENSKGWFRAPRTLPLLLALLRSKKVSGRQDPSSVYLGLWARHFDSGVVEITNEMEMAYEAGYTGGRALPTWQERMALLQKHGFDRIEREECPQAAHLLYKVIASRHQKRSTILITNVDFDAWAAYLGDAPLAMAMLDRLVDGALVFKINGPSYRANRPGGYRDALTALAPAHCATVSVDQS